MLYLSCVVFNYRSQFEPALYYTTSLHSLHVTGNFAIFKSTSSVVFGTVCNRNFTFCLHLATSVTREP